MTKPFTIVQITDTHLHANEEGTLLGLKTAESLARVLESVRSEVPSPDAILATGDISQDYTLGSYQRFMRMMSEFDCPIRWCPGNHDDKSLMAQAAAETSLNDMVLDLGRWRILLLDSAVPGQVPGALEQTQFERLTQSIAQRPEAFHLVAFHHQPLPMGSAWIDTQKIANGEQLIQLATEHQQVKSLLWGHVHQERDDMIGNLRLISTPSTSVQFTPVSDDFSIDQQPPGYRILELHTDGSIETRVVRVEGFEFEIDYQAKGY